MVALDAGAGDRLGLQCDVTGESVPTAMLPYCGRSLLSGIIRDLQVIGTFYSCFLSIGVLYGSEKDWGRLQSWNHLGAYWLTAWLLCRRESTCITRSLDPRKQPLLPS